tara:strand:+ start:623 stop:1234 length:612 start_codon:yes stop_codon:yes gene_type:complete
MDVKLDIILGPMFSGKTTKLFEIMDKLEKENIKFITVKPHIDNRYNNNEKNNFVISHNLKKKECKVSNNLKDIFKEIKINKTITSTRSESIQYVLIDEGQFFKNLYNFTILCLEKLNVNVIVTGLDGDFQRKPMGEILNLLPIANSITKLTSKCDICKKDAIFTHRIVNDSEQVLIGGSDKYIPLCRGHFIEKNELLTHPIDF